MCGSRPEPEAVTASTGTLAGSTPSKAAIAARRSWIVFSRSSLLGPRLEAPEAFGSHEPAEGRGWNHFGSGWACSLGFLRSVGRSVRLILRLHHRARRRKHQRSAARARPAATFSTRG